MSVQLSVFSRLACVLFSSELPVLTLSQVSQELKQAQKVRVDHRGLERFEPLTVWQFVSVSYFIKAHIGVYAGICFFVFSAFSDSSGARRTSVGNSRAQNLRTPSVQNPRTAASLEVDGPLTGNKTCRGSESVNQPSKMMWDGHTLLPTSK